MQIVNDVGAMYINDLLTEIYKIEKCGITVDESVLPIVIYTDNIPFCRRWKYPSVNVTCSQYIVSEI